MANEQIIATGDDIERLDNPLVVKLNEYHFPILGTDEMSTNTLKVPDTVLEASRIDDPLTLTEILVATADRAAQFLE